MAIIKEGFSCHLSSVQNTYIDYICNIFNPQKIAASTKASKYYSNWQLIDCVWQQHYGFCFSINSL